MKTPHAILIGLSLMATAILFKDTMTPPAHAFGGSDGITCYSVSSCWLIDGDKATRFSILGGSDDYIEILNWRTGGQIKP